jgi:acyl carrier protein
MVESLPATWSVDALLRILRGVLEMPPETREITPDETLVDLGVTSFQLMQIIVAIEGELDIEFTYSTLELATSDSIGSLASAVNALLNEQTGTGRS